MAGPQSWRGGPPDWGGGGFGPGRRFRRGALVAFLVLVLLVAALASLVASIATGNHPAPGITIVVSAAVLIALVMSARWLWRSTRSIGALMDAAERVADGDTATRIGGVPGRQLQRLATAFDDMAERLETNEDRRRELLADVAHELRTPLQAIRGSVEALLDGLHPADAEHLRPIRDQTVMMARLLDDLRTLSMAEAGVLTLHRETVDPLGAARDGIEALRARADQAGVELAVSADPATPATIEADPTRLVEVLTNLLANAVHHTPAGGEVSVRLAPAGAQGVSYVVDDTGSGIPDGELPYVFDRFVTTADQGGTGLGLAIARRLVEAHGGTIQAGRGPRGGTRLRVEIP